MLYRPLTKEEVASTIEGRSIADRIPVMLHFWTHPGAFGDREDIVRQLLLKYPMDVQPIGFNMPQVFDAPADDSEYRWVNFDDPDPQNAGGLDAKIAISDWSQLDGVLASFPDPNYANLFPDRPQSDGRYRLGQWWFCLFERHWSLRGMTNALMDYYTDPESVHRLFRALTDFYKAIILRAGKELGIDGIFTSDDIGMQTAGFFSREIFREFFKPYYAEIIEAAHSQGMHFWLHTCGNVLEFMPDFVEIGLDVIHPIQKHTMDEKEIASKYGSDICVWAGLDVQQVIPWGTPDEVRQEIRYLIDTYQRPEGRLMLTAGNGINGDCPVPSLEAFLDEAFSYGTKKLGEL